MDILKRGWVDGKTDREMMGSKIDHAYALKAHVVGLVQQHTFFISEFDDLMETDECRYEKLTY